MLALSLSPLLLILLSSSLGSANKAEPSRSVQVQWNPGCSVPECGPDQNGSFINLVYVKSTGDSDVVHTLYSTFPSLAILLFRSDLAGTLSVDWPALLASQPNAVKVTNSKEKAAYLLPRIFEFDDSTGDADMSKVPQNATFFRTYATAGLTWAKFADHADSLGVLEGHVGDSLNATGSFQFVIRSRGTNSRDKDLPHLLLKPESSSLDFVINHVPATFDLSKFGAEFLFASSDEDSLRQSTKVTMDDEYTPGTFKIWDFEFTSAETTVSYFQCKPIFYFYEPKALENSTLAIKYDTLDKNVTLPSSVATGLFSKVYATNFSFGIQGTVKDGYFYNQTAYSVWSFSVGMGAAPVEKMSFIVTFVIAVGFGLPACIILVGLVVMVARKIKNSRRSNFEVLE